MLSYQHIYHAGNPADVHKHAILAAMLSYMTAKPKPMTYIETHAGRGLYALDSAEARKTGEAEAGVARLAERLRSDHPYRAVLGGLRTAHGPSAYPGSPLVAAHLLRPGDSLHLAEMHPREHAALAEAMSGTRVRVVQGDGFQMAQSICPPTPRRGVLMIDPSYEIKDDYAALPGFITAIHRKWNVGAIALWYPLLKDAPHRPMLRKLESAGLPGALRHEVTFPPVREGHRMVGSGMFVVNAPWGLAEAAAEVGAIFGT